MDIDNIDDKEIRAEEILEEEGKHFLTSVAFRLTRDGDTEISDDADDLLVALESELQKRRQAKRAADLR